MNRSRLGQMAHMGCVGWPHPHNYHDPWFLDAIQSGHNIMALGALRIPCLAIFNSVDPPLPKGRPSITSGPLRFKFCDPATKRKSSKRYNSII